MKSDSVGKWEVYKVELIGIMVMMEFCKTDGPPVYISECHSSGSC